MLGSWSVRVGVGRDGEGGEGGEYAGRGRDASRSVTLKDKGCEWTQLGCETRMVSSVTDGRWTLDRWRAEAAYGQSGRQRPAQST